jgi:hypothetical protein
MRTGLTRVTTDDVRATRKVIEEEDEEEEKKRQKRGEVGEGMEEKMGGRFGRNIVGANNARLDSCLTVPTNLPWDRQDS